VPFQLFPDWTAAHKRVKDVQKEVLDAEKEVRFCDDTPLLTQTNGGKLGWNSSETE